MYILFILKCQICQKQIDLHTRRRKHWTFWLNFLIGVYSMIHIGPVSIVVVVVFNATLNSISVISWWSVLLVEENGAPAENHRAVTSH
jgi:hypothetical protein